MTRPLIVLFAALLAATPAVAETRLWAYDAADRVTQALTRGVTLQVQRGLFGSVRVETLFSTSARGSAEMRRGGPDGVRRALPAGSAETAVYSIVAQGDGRGLSRALCPGSDEAWLVLGRVRQGRPLVMQAVGRWADGTFRHCVQLSYRYRGEWAGQPNGLGAPEEPSLSER